MSKWWLKRTWPAVLLISLLTAACQEMPRQDWEALQEVRAELIRQDAAEFVPQKFASFEDEYSKTQAEYARVKAQFSPLRDVEKLRPRLQSQRTAGEALAQEIKRLREELRQAQQDELETLGQGVQSWRQSLDPSVRKTIAKLELALQQARAAFRQGRYDEVNQLLESAREQTSQVQSHFLEIQQRYRDPALLRKWKSWHEETVRWSKKNPGPALVVDKFHAQAILYRNGREGGRFPVELGWNWLLDKSHQGDGATPEGPYRVLRKKGPGDTKYFLALLLDYPNGDDRRQFQEAKKGGRIAPNASIGGLIEIHGDGGRGNNWTQGCVALDNEAMKKLYDLAYVGMPVTIVGKTEE